MIQLSVLLQPIEIAAASGLKGDEGINARFTSRHPHDFLQRPFVKIVVDLVFIYEEQIGNERQVKTLAGERQLRQSARQIAGAPPDAIIVQKGPIRRLAKLTQPRRRLVEIPAIRLPAINRP